MLDLGRYFKSYTKSTYWMQGINLILQPTWIPIRDSVDCKMELYNQFLVYTKMILYTANILPLKYVLRSVLFSRGGKGDGFAQIYSVSLYLQNNSLGLVCNVLILD